MNPDAALEPPAALSLQPLGHWPETLARLLEQQTAGVVRVLIASLRGSTPREAGACLLVSPTECFGSIGGGQLEWQAIHTARNWLQQQPPLGALQKKILGSELGQCCGGVVELWFESWQPAQLQLLRQLQNTDQQLHTRLQGTTLQRWLEPAQGTGLQLSRGPDQLDIIEPLRTPATALQLFGAGHVGQALVRVLEGLPFDLLWIDTRSELFPPSPPPWLRTRSHDPLGAIAQAPAGAHYVVMTHDHALDYQLVRGILQRGDAGYLGLIGSASKAARFRRQLRDDGIDAAALQRLRCPVGVAGIHSKLPAAIAVSIAAELLQQPGASGPTAAAPPAHGACTAQDCLHCPQASR